MVREFKLVNEKGQEYSLMDIENHALLTDPAGLGYEYYTDTIYVVYYPEEGEDKILEDDIITIWGTSQGDYTYTSTIGASVTLPLIFAEYVSID